MARVTQADVDAIRDKLLQAQMAMQGINPHPDQTTKQPVVWRCPNPECFDTDLDYFFEFKADEPVCPKCGLGPPAVQKRVLIHFLVRDSKGPIYGQMGLRYRMACDARRSYLATPTNGEAATGDPTSVNCPGCLAAPELLKGLAQGVAMVRQSKR